MLSHFVQLVALLAALATAAPPRACCVPQVKGKHEEPARASCCQAKQAQHKRTARPHAELPGRAAPCEHVSGCCCRNDAQRPDTPVSAPVDLSLTFADVPVDADGPAFGPALPVSADDTSPPCRLHVLQCVWRC
jgi:hypothetical protein